MRRSICQAAGPYASAGASTGRWSTPFASGAVPHGLSGGPSGLARLFQQYSNQHRPYGVGCATASLRAHDLAPSEDRNVSVASQAGIVAEMSATAEASGEEEDPLQRRSRLEAVLLMAKSPLSTRKLAQLARLADATEARTFVRELNQLYDSLGRALRIEQLAGGYRLMTRPALAPWLARLGYLPPAIRLSSPMMETLTVVAYRQPVSRADVEAIRGVACGELLRQLLERDLVRIAGRSEELGRPYLYGTTKRFLQLFGLSGADALPSIEWQAWQDDIPDQETQQVSDSTSQDFDTSLKESVVSTAVAPVPSEADLDVTRDPNVSTAVPEDAGTDQDQTRAVIEDEEDEIYEGTGDLDEEDDLDDDLDDDFDEDWDDDEDDLDDDDDLDEDEDLDDDEEPGDDVEGSEWVEVGDDDWDEDDDEEDDWDEEDDDEDWD